MTEQKTPAQLYWEKRIRRRTILFRIFLALFAVVILFSITPIGRSFWKNAFRDSSFSGPAIEAPLHIHLLDVGKADAIVLECEGHAAVLDGGNSGDGEIVSDYLSRCGISSLDYAIMSHPDKDHIGGMAQVLLENPVDTFVQGDLSPKLEPDSREYEDMLSALDTLSIGRKTVHPGDVLYLGGAQLKILGPVEEYSDTNSSSLVFKLIYGDFSALFCGDIEKEAERDLVKSGADLSADLLKVAHHGSKTSSSKRLLQAVSPQYAAISVGPDQNELPDEEVLRRLEEADIQLYRTDTDGNIVFSYTGTELWVETEK